MKRSLTSESYTELNSGEKRQDSPLLREIKVSLKHE